MSVAAREVADRYCRDYYGQYPDALEQALDTYAADKDREIAALRAVLLAEHRRDGWPACVVDEEDNDPTCKVCALLAVPPSGEPR